MKKIFLCSIIIATCFYFSGCEKKDSKINVAESNEIIEEKNPDQELAEESDDTTPSTEQTEKTSNGHVVTVLPEPLPRIVKTDDGSNLNFRSEPVDGEKQGQFPNGTNVQITKLTNETFTVDGICDAWYYAQDNATPPHEGWVFGGYLSVPNEVEYSSGNDECNTIFLTGIWENDRIIIEIFDDDGTFFLGRKESEGFSGTWKLLDDDTLYVYDCKTYDEDPWTVTYKIKVCTNERLVLVREEDDFTIDLQRGSLRSWDEL